MIAVGVSTAGFDLTPLYGSVGVAAFVLKDFASNTVAGIHNSLFSEIVVGQSVRVGEKCEGVVERIDMRFVHGGRETTC